MAIELYNDGNHKCIGFYDLVIGEGIQSNQFLVVDGDNSALLDPGGDLIYNDLFMQSYKYLFTKNLEFVIGSHQDPDIISSLDKWMVGSDCKIIIPTIWKDFITHFASPGRLRDRVIGIPDKGMDIQLGMATLKALPAHFLHSEGNFSFYDITAKILFSGDIGASLVTSDQQYLVENFDDHIQYMEGFHKRYMRSNQVCRYWVNMVRKLDLELIVPQHGRAFKGKEMIEHFLLWLENLECGLDLITQDNYKILKAV